jgi:hypothetical protein
VSYTGTSILAANSPWAIWFYRIRSFFGASMSISASTDALRMVLLTSSDHDFPYTMYRQDIIGVHGLDENNRNIVQHFIVNVLSIGGAKILNKLLP